MPIRLLTSGGGTTTLQPTTSASSVTLTIPSVNANVVTTGDTASVTQAMIGSGLAGTGPLFRVHQSATSSLTSGTWNKVTYTSVLHDTNSNYSTSTSRFTPTVAGYYMVNAGTLSSAAIVQNTAIYKNGSQIIRGFYTNTSSVQGSSVSGIVYMNGSTDYLEVYCFNGGSTTTTTGDTGTWFDGFLARAA